MLYLTDDFGRYTQCDTLEQVRAESDALLAAKTGVLAIDTADNDLTYYPTAVGTRWRGQRMDKLYDAGHDVFGLAVERLRAGGGAVLANIRMNDHHGGEDMWTFWARAHTDWSLGKDTGDREWRAVGDLRQMNYAVEGVRKHLLNIAREILTQYPVDGLQLDFGRTAPFLADPKRENAKLLTQYVRDVRSVLGEFGKTRSTMLRLGAILPWDMDFCEKEGIEAGQWMKEGLLDHVAPGEWYYAEWNMPLSDWSAIVKGTTCKLVPMMCGNVAPYQGFERAPSPMLDDNHRLVGPQIRAVAANYLAQGAHGIMLYNYYSSAHGNDYPHLREWTDAEQIKRMDRHYYFCRRLHYTPTEHDAYTVGEAFFRFPLNDAGDKLQYPFRIHADASSDGLLRFKALHLHDHDQLVVSLNGTALTAPSITRTVARGRTEGTVGIWATPVKFPPLKQGENVIAVELSDAAAARTTPIEVAEIEVLMQGIGQ